MKDKRDESKTGHLSFCFCRVSAGFQRVIPRMVREKMEVFSKSVSLSRFVGFIILIFFGEKIRAINLHDMLK